MCRMLSFSWFASSSSFNWSEIACILRSIFSVLCSGSRVSISLHTLTGRAFVRVNSSSVTWGSVRSTSWVVEFMMYVLTTPLTFFTSCSPAKIPSPVLSRGRYPSVISVVLVLRVTRVFVLAGRKIF